MKKKSLFVMGMALLAFSARSNDDFTTENGKGVDAAIESGELTYITIKIANGPSTRIGEGNAESGGVENKNVKTLQLFIFDATTNTLEVNKEYNVTNNTMSAKELVTPGTKKVYALANLAGMPDAKTALAPTTFLPKATNSTLDVFLKMTHALAAANGLTALVNTGNGYVMSSSEKDAEKTFEAGVTEDVTDKNSVVIDLYYVLSKLAIKLKEEDVLGNLGSGILGALSSPEFVVRNIANKFYLIEKNPIQGFYYDSIPANPQMAASWHQYYKVPTFVGFKSIGTTIENEGMLMTENVVKDPKIGNTTYAAIRAKFNPAAGSVVTDAKWSPTLNALVLTKGGLSGNTGTFVRSAKAYTNLPLGTVFKDEDTAKKAIALAKKGSNIEDNNYNTAIANEDYVIHTNGICYYRMNVGADVETDVTKNSVERGRSYEATINKITGFGYNSEGKLDGSDTTGPIKPEDPLNQKTYITVSILVKGWVTTATEGELN